MFYVSFPKQEKFKVKRTKKRSFVIKNKNNIVFDKPQKQDKKVPVQSVIEELIRQEIIKIHQEMINEYYKKWNDATLITKIMELHSKKYYLRQIRDRIKKEYNVDKSRDELMDIIKDNKRGRKGNPNFHPVIPNQNGKKRHNTETYHEIF